MASSIPEEKISEVKNAVDIVDIVSESVILKKAGKNFLGLCPFHSEKTPSFSVSPEKQIFHCFGCGAGGNVFTFVMKHHGLSFPETVRSLARRSGISLPEREMTEAQKREFTEREKLLRVNRIAQEYFRQLLSGSHGSNATAYLGSRGIDEPTRERFGLGYAPGAWDGLVRQLRRQRVPLEIAEKAGLIIAKKDRPGYYDRFRDRLMFPIADIGGQIVGFGGRIIGKGEPKYLNSPETPVFNKRRVLYGLMGARQACRRERAVFIVEGYMDVIRLQAGGIENAVATLGTALTPDHLRALKGHVGQGQMILVFDADPAGIQAAHRSLDLFFQEHANFAKGEVFTDRQADTRILILPEGHDPDSFVREFGAARFREAAEKAKGIIAFLMDAAVAAHGLTSEGKVRIVDALQGPLSRINDPVARSVYIKDLAERLDIQETAIRRKLESAGSRGAVPAGRKIDPAHDGRKVGGGPREHRLERQILTMMLQYPPIGGEVRRRRVVERFRDPALRRMAERLMALRDRDVADAVGCFDSAEEQRMAAELAMSDIQWDDAGCRRVLKQFEDSIARRDRGLLERIRAAEADGDMAALTALLKEKQSIARKRQRQQ